MGNIGFIYCHDNTQYEYEKFEEVNNNDNKMKIGETLLFC